MTIDPIAADAARIAALPYGHQTPMGMYVSTVLADMDFETYSEAGYDLTGAKIASLPGFAPTKRGIGAVGARVYTEHPSFEILSLKYDLKDGHGVRTWRPGEPNPQALFDHVIAQAKLIEAWNAGFEMWVWRAAVRLYGWPPVPHANFRCAMAKSRAYGRPGKLEKAAEVAGTLRKDPAGDALLKRFAMPQNPTKARPAFRTYPHDDPEAFGHLLGYNETDIKAEAHNSYYTPDLSPVELEHWQIDQAINRRGVHIDVESLRAAAQIIQQADAQYGQEMLRLTGGIKPTELQQLRGWCAALGCSLATMDEDAINEALGRDNLNPAVRRVLEIRSLVGSASVKKVFAMLNQAGESHRLSDLFSFHAARTGRPTGNGPQPTNMPKAGPNVWQCACMRWYGESRPSCPWCLRGPEYRVAKQKDGSHVYLGADAKPSEWNPDAMKDAITIMRVGNLGVLEHFFGEALRTVAGCLRGMFDAAPGHRLMSSDYTAIEAVVLACVAGEQWRIDLFVNRGKIYEASGAVVHGISYDDVIAHKERTGQHHPCRQDGKTLELAAGYGGWITAWRNFDPNPDTTDDYIRERMESWRRKSPAIVEFWGGQSRRLGYGRRQQEFYGVEGTFIKAALNPNQWFEFRGFWFISDGRTLYLRLLSGRYIVYHDVTLRPSTRDGNTYDISYWGWNTNPLNGPQQKWIEIRTHGGKLTENIVQAVSNDVLRYALAGLERANYPVVLHVYDEIVSEVPDGFGDIREFETIMGTLPEWAVLADGTPWPIRADGGWIDNRYRKG